MTTTLKTRSDYLDSKCTHAEYYGQFVSPAVKKLVTRAIGIEQLRTSTDEHLNDIPLAQWDSLAPEINAGAGKKLRECGDFPTLSSGVCIAKCAARQILAFAD